jgi:hypothetical protein
MAAWAAAILAVAALCYASTKSVVMQAVEASPSGMPVLCSARMGATTTVFASDEMGRLVHAPGPLGKSKTAVCPYCSAAAHAPMLASVVPLTLPVAVQWLIRAPSTINEPHGPPASEARARSPPVLPAAV